MGYDSTNNVFSDISDCELVEASQLVEELECSYLSDVELVSAVSQNVEDTLKVSGENETLFWLQPSFGSFLLYRCPINVDAC